MASDPPSVEPVADPPVEHTPIVVPPPRPAKPRVTQGRVPEVLADSAAWAGRLLVVGLLAWGLFITVEKLLLIVIPLLVALLTSALLTPINHFFRRRLPRGPAAAVTLVLAVIVLGGVGYFVVERAISGYPTLQSDSHRVVLQVQKVLNNGPFHLHLKAGSADDLSTEISTLLSAHKGAVASGVLSAGKTAVDVVTGLLLWIFLTVFFVYDGDRMWAWVVGLFPDSTADRVRGVGQRAWRTISGYIVGQFFVASFHATVIGVSLLILQAPLVTPLALIVFIGSFVPIIGALVAGGFAVLVLLVAGGAVKALILLIILIVDDQVEGHLLQPLIVGRYVRLHPVAIALTLAAGALVAGLPGAVFGVPLVATVNAVAKFLAGREDADGNPIPRGG